MKDYLNFMHAFDIEVRANLINIKRAAADSSMNGVGEGGRVLRGNNRPRPANQKSQVCEFLSTLTSTMLSLTSHR